MPLKTFSCNLKSTKGISLIELLFATFLLTGTLVTISLLFPRSMQSMQNERDRWKATNLASSKMQEIKAIPYPLIGLTPVTAGAPPVVPPFSAPPFFSPETEPPGCNCRSVNFDDPNVMPPPYSDRVNENNIVYTRQVCVARVERNAGGTWDNHCPSFEPDPNNLLIRVRVSWQKPDQDRKFIETEGFVSRS